MVDFEVNGLDPKWSALLKQTVSVDVAHSSAKKLVGLNDRDKAILQELVSDKNLPETIHVGKIISALVNASPTKEVGELLGHVIADPQRSTDVRALAAVELRHLPLESAKTILLQSLAIKDSKIQYRVIQSLGRIGGSEELAQLQKLAEPGEAFVRRQLAFAKRLIEYRLGVTAQEPLRASGTNWLIDHGYKPLPLSVKTIDKTRFQDSLESLKNTALGIDLTSKNKFALDLGADNYLIFNQRLENEEDQKSFIEKPSIAAIIAIWNKRTKSAELNQFLLSTPYDRGVLLHSYRLDGSPRFEGYGVVRKKILHFTLTSFERPGQCVYRIEGQLSVKGVVVENAVTLKTVPSRRTVPLNI